MNDDLDGELAQDAAAMPPDESEQGGLGLEEPRADAILNRQVEEQMAVHDVGVSFALSAPHARQPTDNSPPK